MSTMFADTLLIVFISVCTALLAEGEGGCFLGRLVNPRVEGHWGPSHPLRNGPEPHFLRLAWSVARNPGLIPL